MHACIGRELPSLKESEQLGHLPINECATIMAGTVFSAGDESKLEGKLCQ